MIKKLVYKGLGIVEALLKANRLILLNICVLALSDTWITASQSEKEHRSPFSSHGEWSLGVRGEPVPTLYCKLRLEQPKIYGIPINSLEIDVVGRTDHVDLLSQIEINGIEVPFQIKCAKNDSNLIICGKWKLGPIIANGLILNGNGLEDTNRFYVDGSLYGEGSLMIKSITDISCEGHLTVNLKGFHWLDQFSLTNAFCETDVIFTPHKLLATILNLVVEKIKIGPITLEQFKAKGTIEPHFGELVIHHAKILEGEIQNSRVILNLVKRELEGQLRFKEIDLACLLQEFPSLPLSVIGKVDGEVDLKASPYHMEIATGIITLKSNTTAYLSYMGKPWLTKELALSSENYTQLKLVEEAFKDLKVEFLEIKIQSTKHDQPFLEIKLQGNSTNNNMLIPIHLGINVHGSLEDLIWFLKISKCSYEQEQSEPHP